MTNWILPCRLVTAVCLFLSICFVTSFQARAGDSWRIVEISPEGRVHLRQHASNRSRILAYIPGNARGLKRLGCQGKWCRTVFRGKTGWVYKRYLAPDRVAARNNTPQNVNIRRNLADLDEGDLAALSQAKELSVFNPAGKAIPVYAFPSETLPIAGRLDDGVNSVEGLGACVKGWCYIRSGPLIGWLPAFILAPVHDGDEGDHETTAAIAETLAHTDEQKEQPALNNTINTATQASPDIAEHTASLYSKAGNKFYSLAGLAGKETLPIHAKPSDRSRIVGRIEQNEKQVEGLKNCSGKWCLVRVNDIRGWIERRHLADPEIDDSQTFKVTGLPFWSPLDVVDRPGKKASVVDKIPSYATGIVPIGDCNETICHVRYLGIAGWVDRTHLTPLQK